MSFPAGQTVFVLDPWGGVCRALYVGTRGGLCDLSALRHAHLCPPSCAARRVFGCVQDARNHAPAAAGLGSFIWR